MAILSFLCGFLVVLALVEPSLVKSGDGSSKYCRPIEASDKDLIQVALNLEYLETEFFLYGALGKGLESINPSLANGGPPPIGARKADLDPFVNRIIEEFGYQEVGHLRAIISNVGGFPRPLLDLSTKNFAELFDKAAGFPLKPPFDPYADTIKYLLAAYAIPYVGLNGYVGTIPYLIYNTTKSLTAKLLGVESGQDAVIRALLYEKAKEKVYPYDITVEKFTNYISKLRNDLGGCGLKDEGIIVPPELGAENRTSGNVLSADYNSLSYARTPQEIFRIVYASGDESKPGGFYPNGANGKIAQSFLKSRDKDSGHL